MYRIDLYLIYLPSDLGFKRRDQKVFFANQPILMLNLTRHLILP